MGNSNLLSRKGHRGLIFPGKSLETENFKWARFPKEFPEMCANANPSRPNPPQKRERESMSACAWRRCANAGLVEW
eukprot:1483909-Prymnesium_polylepis.1